MGDHRMRTRRRRERQRLERCRPVPGSFAYELADEMWSEGHDVDMLAGLTGWCWHRADRLYRGEVQPTAEEVADARRFYSLRDYRGAPRRRGVWGRPHATEGGR